MSPGCRLCPSCMRSHHSPSSEAEIHGGRDSPATSLIPSLKFGLRSVEGQRSMDLTLSCFATRAAYGARQLPRMAWYVGHGLAMRRLARLARHEPGERARPRAHTDAPVPDGSRFLADITKLLQRDLANVEAGLYPLPANHD